MEYQANSMSEYDIVVAYRVYPKISGNCGYFVGGNKFDLTKLCLDSFKSSFGNIKVKMFAILDRCPQEYEDLFHEYFDDDDLNIIKISEGGNRETFVVQLKVLLEQNHSNIVMLAEDDYFYLPNTMKHAVDVLKQDKVDFITTYNHLDYYTMQLYNIDHKYIFTENMAWKRVGATTCSFATTKNILKKTYTHFSSYRLNNSGSDIHIFLRLTKTKMRSPMFFIYITLVSSKIGIKILKICEEYLLRYTDLRNINYDPRPARRKFLDAWIKANGWKQIMFGKKYNLYSPTFPFSTHLSSQYMSPNHDWDHTMIDSCNEINVDQKNIINKKYHTV
jgi:hypothetical protein